MVRSDRNSNSFRDFIPLQVICKFHKVKTKQALFWTRSDIGVLSTIGQVLVLV